MSDSITTITNRRCFLISPIGKPGSETRIFADKVKEFLYNEVISPLQFTLFRGDEVNESGMIRDDMITHILDDDLVITLLDYANVNVYYELAVRHASRKVCFVIMSAEDFAEHKPPFDNSEVRVIQFSKREMRGYAPGCNLSPDFPELITFKSKLSGDIQKNLTNNYEIKNPIIHANQAFLLPARTTAVDLIQTVESKLTSFYQGMSDRITQMEVQLDKLEPDQIMNTINEVYDNGIATYIDGEDQAFEKLAEVTQTAKESLRTSRFAPQAISDSKRSFFDALCAFGKRKGVECKRIMCMNKDEKMGDLWKTISDTCGGSMQLYLTNRNNNFELVIVDQSAAFLHFYDDDNRIKSTLFIKGQPVIKEFTRIYDRMLNDSFYNFQVIDCGKYKYVADAFEDVNTALVSLQHDGVSNHQT